MESFPHVSDQSGAPAGMLCPSPVPNPNALAAAMRSLVARVDRLVYFAVLVYYKTDELSFACVYCAV